MRTAIFGSQGYLGGYFLQKYPEALHEKIDIAERESLRTFLDQEKPDVVINCAGKTGRPNVDWCEDHKEETLRSNVTGALILMEECLARGIFLVHVGSGCIYQGDNGGRGFTEDDVPNYMGSFYSRTKAWSDQILKDFPVLNLRLRMPFDGSTNPRNLIMKLKGYTKVLDAQNSLTCLPDFLDATARLIEMRKTGTFNIVNPGTTSPYQIMEMYREIVDPSHQFERLTLDHLGDVTKAGRSNCILSTEKLEKEGIQLPPIERSVRRSLEALRV